MSLCSKVRLNRIKASMFSLSFVAFIIIERAWASYNISIASTLKNYLCSLEGICVFILGMPFVFFLALKYFTYEKKANEFLFTFRWIIAAGFLLILVSLRVSGSSISVWEGCDGWNGLFFGNGRWCRSDEYLVNTPMAISQFFSSMGPYSYFSDAFRGSLSDMFIVYGQPVADWPVIFRPTHWGYLLLGPEFGLSFFWCSRLILLFMVTFECGRLLTNDNRPLSLVFALLIAFAPVIQWWFAINGYIESIVSCELIVLMVNAYLRTGSYLRRFCFCLGCVLCAGCFVLTFYPAFIVPLAYLLVITVVAVVVKRRPQSSLFGFKDILVILLSLFLFIAAMLAIFFKSWDAIQTVLNTSYPGKRFSSGGDSLEMLFLYPLDLLLPFKGSGSYRPDAYSSFFDFAPAGFLLALHVIFKQKDRDIYLLLLLVLNLFIGCYCFVGFPDWLASITLFNRTTSGFMSKAYLVFGIVNIILLIRSYSLLECKVGSTKSLLVVCVVVALIWTLLCRFFFSECFSLFEVAASFVFLAVGFFLFTSRNTKLLVPYVLILSVLSGFAVNPVQVGVSPITQNPLVKTVSEIEKNQGHSTWLVVDSEEGSYADLVATTGASVVDTCNVYPNLSLWSRLDEQGQYKDIYNRYAHISAELTEDETFFELTSNDSFTLHLNVNDIEKLNIDYLISGEDLSAFSDGKVRFDVVGRAWGKTIYAVKNVN